MKFNRNDIILTAAVLLVAVVVFLAFLFNMQGGQNAQISVDGEIVCTLKLTEETEKEIETKWGKNTVWVKDGQVSVIFADCRDKICQNHRSISKTGETIVCLPHKMVVEII